MTAEASGLVAFTVAGMGSLTLTPVAIQIARRAGFLDRPGGYHRHDSPTPFLGGAAVLLAVLVATAIVGAFSGKLIIVLGGALVMWLVGTLDDRFAVAPTWRLLAAAGAALALDRAGLGWHTAGGAVVDGVLTVVWIVGLVNALNLMDNLDGACSTVTAVAGAGIGVMAAIQGQPAIAGLAFALSGACAGFLPFNLSRPARIFLGDGGSMPMGFLLAALAMATSRHSQAGDAGLLVGALLVGLPILDVALVSLSRTRRNVSLTTGGRDHLTHRMLLVLRTPRRVAISLMLLQGILCVCAVAGHELGSGTVVGLAFAAFVASVVAILVLDTARWRPAGIAAGPQRSVGGSAEASAPVGVDPV